MPGCSSSRPTLKGYIFSQYVIPILKIIETDNITMKQQSFQYSTVNLTKCHKSVPNFDHKPVINPLMITETNSRKNYNAIQLTS